MRTAYRVYGKKIKQIASKTGHSKNTIKKALLNEHNGYKAGEKQLYPALGHYLKIIDKCLKDAKEMPKKQRHTAVRVYNRLVQKHNFKGSEGNSKTICSRSQAEIGSQIQAGIYPIGSSIWS